MGDKTETGAGGCLCGAVRFQAAGEPVVTGHCHCSDCRRHNGGPVVTLVIFPADKVRFTVGERKIYQSSPGLGRAFCGQCGTPLTIESEKHDPQNIEFHIALSTNLTLTSPACTGTTVGGSPGLTLPTICPAITA